MHVNFTFWNVLGRMKCPRISVLKEMNWVGKWKSKPQTPLGPDQLNNWSRMKFEELEDPSSSWPNVKRKLWNNYSLDWWWIQEKIPSIFYSHIHHAKHWCLPAGADHPWFCATFFPNSVFSPSLISNWIKKFTVFENNPKCLIWILAFFTKNCLSGNTVWSQASGFQKLAKIDHFWHF